MEDSRTANQLYKESGSDLPFKDWISEIKQDSVFVKNQLLTKIVEDSKNLEPAKPQTQDAGKFLGLSKTVLLISGVIIISAIIYKVASKKQ